MVNDSLKNPLVIYHGNCNDGSAAATCAYWYFGNSVEYYPATHGKPFDISKVKDRSVFFLDFCLPKAIMEAVAEDCWNLTILDHHKTAQEDIQDLAFSGKFDMEKSGAMLAFEHFVEKFPETNERFQSIRKFVSWVQDRDIWKWELENTREVNDYLFSLPAFTIETADIWLNLFTGKDTTDVVAAGKAIGLYKKKQLGISLSRAFKAEMFGEKVWVSNDTHLYSELAGELATKGKFGVCYYINEEGKYIYSLRSQGDFDVSALARTAGGGGHRKAAGCSAWFPLHRKL